MAYSLALGGHKSRITQCAFNPQVNGAVVSIAKYVLTIRFELQRRRLSPMGCLQGEGSPVPLAGQHRLPNDAVASERQRVLRGVPLSPVSGRRPSLRQQRLRVGGRRLRWY